MSAPVRPSYGFPWIGQLNTPNYLQISSGIRNNGYPADAALPAADYNEIHLEEAQWIAYLDYYTTLLSTAGVYTQLTGATALSSLTTGVSVVSAWFARIMQQIHLELVLNNASYTGAGPVKISIPSIIAPIARYYGGGNMGWPCIAPQVTSASFVSASELDLYVLSGNFSTSSVVLIVEANYQAAS